MNDNYLTEHFAIRLSKAQHEGLTQLSINESVRTGQHVSRADWLRKKIDQAMAREARKK